MAKKFLNGIDLQSQKIINVADGVNPTDGASKQQLDAAVRGLEWKHHVRAVASTNITLTGAQTIDGVSLLAGDSVLLKGQTTASANGIYVVATGTWARRSDAATSAMVVSGMTTTVTEGTTKGTATTMTLPMAWTLSTPDTIVLDTTSLTFVAVGGSGAVYTAGNGLSLSGASVFAVVAGSGIIADGTSTRADFTILPRKYSVSVGDGSTTSLTVTHNLATLDVQVQIYEVSTGTSVEADTIRATTNTVTLTFAVAPTSSQYRCVVIG